MRRLLVAVGLAMLLAPPAADAHSPGRLDSAAVFTVAQPKDSQALFGEFRTGDEVFVVRMTLDERFAVPVEMLVPHQAALARHRPAWALVGPGVPPPSPEELEALPQPLPPGAGAVVDLNTVESRPVIYEFVMRRFFWSSGAMNVVLPEGTSELWVWSPGRTRGKFGLGFGVEEGGEYMAALKDWSFYAY